MAKIIGIDLGTTNSCVAVVDVTTPQVIPNREGSRTTPSVVGFTEDSERLVGQIAKRQAITNPFNTVYAIKRLIGRKHESDEVGRAKQVLRNQIVAVYDLGGGTFDISILKLEDGLFEVLSTSGDTYLGGEDFDKRVMDWLIEGFQRDSGIDLRQDRMALQRLKEAAERAKHELSVNPETRITLPFISADASGPKHLNSVLARHDFERMVEDLIQRTIDPVNDAMRQANVTARQIDEIVLVGGQTRMPKVIEAVEKAFGKAANRNINPDEVVAVGAAIQGGILRGDIKDMVLLDITPLSLGIETHGGLFTKLIDRNSTIPTKNSLIFTTVADNQNKVQAHVLQGEREFSRENKSLGKFDLVGIPPAPRGVPQIEVIFAIDSNGIVNVTARDQATGQSTGVQINPAGGLSQDEIQRLVNEAAEHQRADAVRREIRMLQNKLEGMIYTNDKVFREFAKPPT